MQTQGPRVTTSPDRPMVARRRPRDDRGMTVAPVRRLVLIALAAGYAVVHAWWAVAGAPPFAPPGESFVSGGWLPVVPAVASGAAVLLLGSSRGGTRARRMFVSLAWISGCAAILYSIMFPLSALMIMGLVFGMDSDPHQWTRLVAQGSGVLLGVLTITTAIAERRRVTNACTTCSRIHGRSPERRSDPSPRWAYVAAYLTIIACVSRMTGAVLDGFLESRSADVSPAFLWFSVMLLVLTGTVLPLALVHRWGRIWPFWVVPLSGRHVPRWIVLGPAFFIGGGLTGYFGVSGTAAWITGNNLDDPWWLLAMILPAYTIWGVGLLVAGASYFRLTKRECLYPPRPATGVSAVRARGTAQADSG